MPMAAHAQEAAEETLTQDVVVVQGIRGSLERAMDIKRDSNGVVDAISAEDIGKFPDTNLAESLQRITGVSINRVNGEGSEITVRGFGPGFNLVTLNGRTMPTAKVRAIGARGNYGSGGDRAFDFSNLASEGVNGLEVYKTGQAVLPSGGLGATVNIKTRTPFDDPGLNASFSAKAINDTSVESGDDFTPELSGLASWTDDSDRFGIGVFGSYSKRDSA
ncbi:MAG TPA: TonB-dependent receptor, partial [Hyphomonas atlantica]|nr:TonB-dependent receptor [Hyphomonas atlantica]